MITDLKSKFSSLDFSIESIFDQVNGFLSSAIQSGGMYQNTANTLIEYFDFDFDMDILYQIHKEEKLKHYMIFCFLTKEYLINYLDDKNVYELACDLIDIITITNVKILELKFKFIQNNSYEGEEGEDADEVEPDAEMAAAAMAEAEKARQRRRWQGGGGGADDVNMDTKLSSSSSEFIKDSNITKIKSPISPRRKSKSKLRNKK